MTPTEQDKKLNKLVWLVRVHKNSHYGCEYRQDGLERESVKCGGCCHSSESIKRAEQNIIDFVSSITADRKRVALEARLQEVEVSIIELERSDDPRFYSKDEAIRSQRARYTQLKAQQEEV